MRREFFLRVSISRWRWESLQESARKNMLRACHEESNAKMSNIRRHCSVTAKTTWLVVPISCLLICVDFCYRYKYLKRKYFLGKSFPTSWHVNKFWVKRNEWMNPLANIWRMLFLHFKGLKAALNVTSSWLLVYSEIKSSCSMKDELWLRKIPVSWQWYHIPWHLLTITTLSIAFMNWIVYHPRLKHK